HRNLRDMGNRQKLPHSRLTETKPKSHHQPPSEKVISHFYRKKIARPSCSRSFVDEAFPKCRERFGSKRMSSAGKLKGDAAPASKVLWRMRDLKKGGS
ncbi:MAG: hypothetical protein ACRCXD_16145, partial [Luteolibacter sp.]